MARERDRKLANWKGSQRKDLIAQLREVVRPRGESQQKLFDQLLLRMELSEFATSKTKVNGIEAREAAKIMGKEWGGTENPATYTPVALLRNEIAKSSLKLLIDPGAYLTSPPYKIEVTSDPPSKKYSEKCIGLVLADASDWFVGDVLKGILQACKEADYDLIVEISDSSQQTEAKKIRHLAGRVWGLLVVPVGDRAVKSAVTALQEIPTVLIDRYFVNIPDLPCVHPADKAAGRFAATYLKGQGCKRILIVDQGGWASTNLSITPLKDRQDGCLEADEQIDVRVLRQAGVDEEGGFEALKNFEAEEGPIRKTDGIFALTDHVAVGCHSYLSSKRKGLTVPIISVEGQRFGNFTEPPLLSIKFNNVEMGRLAAAILIAKIECKPLPDNVTLPHTEITPRLLAPSSGPKRREETSIPID